MATASAGMVTLPLLRHRLILKPESMLDGWQIAAVLKQVDTPKAGFATRKERSAFWSI